MFGDTIIKCYNCKTDLTLSEYTRAWAEVDGDETQLKYCLCNNCEDKRIKHHNYINSFEEE